MPPPRLDWGSLPIPPAICHRRPGDRREEGVKILLAVLTFRRIRLFGSQQRGSGFMTRIVFERDAASPRRPTILGFMRYDVAHILCLELISNNHRLKGKVGEGKFV